jgi:hypothetical protein
VRGDRPHWSSVPDIGGRTSAVTGNVRAGSFLRQRLDIAIQSGNVAAVVGTFPVAGGTLKGGGE